MKIILLFLMGFTGVTLICTASVLASKHLNTNIAYVLGTTLGTLCGLAIGGYLNK